MTKRTSLWIGTSAFIGYFGLFSLLYGALMDRIKPQIMGGSPSPFWTVWTRPGQNIAGLLFAALIAAVFVWQMLRQLIPSRELREARAMARAEFIREHGLDLADVSSHSE